MRDKQIAGFVGVMDIATRTLKESEENVGGIWGVVTHPAHARKGIFKALMQKSHNYFKEQGYKFSLLYTSKILIAYALYHKLGYEDTIGSPSAYKVIKETKKTAKKTRKKIKLDWDKILELYNQATKNYTGFRHQRQAIRKNAGNTQKNSTREIHSNGQRLRSPERRRRNHVY